MDILKNKKNKKNKQTKKKKTKCRKMKKCDSNDKWDIFVPLRFSPQVGPKSFIAFFRCLVNSRQSFTSILFFYFMPACNLP